MFFETKENQEAARRKSNGLKPIPVTVTNSGNGTLRMVKREIGHVRPHPRPDGPQRQAEFTNRVSEQIMYYTYPFKDADERTKWAVWQKGRIIPGHDSNVWRWDVCGHVIRYSEHGNTNSQHGWEIDHIYPREHGGPSTLENLQPLYWETNRSKGDKIQWSCAA